MICAYLFFKATFGVIKLLCKIVFFPVIVMFKNFDVAV